MSNLFVKGSWNEMKEIIDDIENGHSRYNFPWVIGIIGNKSDQPIAVTRDDVEKFLSQSKLKGISCYFNSVATGDSWETVCKILRDHDARLADLDREPPL